jgi:hypothetical protein
MKQETKLCSELEEVVGRAHSLARGQNRCLNTSYERTNMAVPGNVFLAYMHLAVTRIYTSIVRAHTRIIVCVFHDTAELFK